MTAYGGQSETAPVRRLLLKHPKDAFKNAAAIAAQWQDLGYPAAPDLVRANHEYDRLVDLLRAHIPQLAFLPPDERTGLDSVYVRDPLLITDHGAILCNMGKPQRKAEAKAAAEFLQTLDIPILGEISGSGCLEGGDLIWLDERTIVVGRGYRTNDDGIRQLRALTQDFVEEIMVVPLPHWNGPGEVLHLMSLISPIDRDLALVYSRLLPVPFREFLLSRDIQLVEVSDSEYNSMAGNVLAIAPRHCVLLSGNPQTKAALEKAGATVHEFDGHDICHKGAGGPTCLTRPLLRQVS